MVCTRTWQDRIPTNMRFGRKVEDAITDAGGADEYPANTGRIWYKHVNTVGLPQDPAYQDWQNTIGEIIKTWEDTAEYMIDKRETGRSMLNAQETFMTRSVEAIGLPIQLYTLRKTHAEAIAECQEITRLGDTWCNEVDRFYSLRPDEGRQQR